MKIKRIFFYFILLTTCLILLSCNTNNQLRYQEAKWADSVDDVILEFIPPTFSKRCEIGQTCLINVKLKNVGQHGVYVQPGDFSDEEITRDTGVNDDVLILRGKKGMGAMFPGETSNVVQVNAFSYFELAEGNYNIKIPIQLFKRSGERIGQLPYYYEGEIYFYE